MTPRYPSSRCRGKNKNGEPCRAAATSGGLCFFHANPNKASELGRNGGRSKSRLSPQSSDPLPVLDRRAAVRDSVERFIAEVYAGKVPPRVTASLTHLLSLQLRAVETTDMAQRLAKIEKFLAKNFAGDRDEVIPTDLLGEPSGQNVSEEGGPEENSEY